MEPVVLRTARLVLNAPRGEDAAAVLAATADGSLRRWLTLPERFGLADAQRIVDGAPEDWARDRAFAFAVREHGALAGMVTVTAHDRGVGYWLDPAARGRGLAVEALGAVLDWLGEVDADAPVRWECRVGNTASLTVARAAGFRYLGRGPGSVRLRDGTHPESWLAVLDRWPRRPHDGWPT